MNNNSCKLQPLILGISAGILWSISIFLMGVLALYFNYGEGFVLTLGKNYYLGYSSTILGSLIGAAWAFIDAFIGGFMLGWLYNKLLLCGIHKKQSK